MKKFLILILSLALSACVAAGCKKQETFVNPGDYLDGGGMGPGRR